MIDWSGYDFLEECRLRSSFRPFMPPQKIVLVTGATRGIGRAIALTLADPDMGRAYVVGTATSAAGAQAISEDMAERVRGPEETMYPGGCGVVLDVTDAAACEALMGELAKKGGPHILVNNAGITRDNLAMRMKDEDWAAVLDTNLSAAFRLSRAAIRGMMKARWGRIITVTSVVGASGNAGQANYAAAKAGLAGMTRALARELGSRGITVNCVAPGFIDTDMTRALGEAQTSALLQQIPLGRLGSPEDVAAAVAFLAGPQAEYITGATLHVNGGMYMQ
jgi:3-oxoacyl-[acyl-carrier protein] reductase